MKLFCSFIQQYLAWWSLFSWWDWLFIGIFFIMFGLEVVWMGCFCRCRWWWGRGFSLPLFSWGFRSMNVHLSLFDCPSAFRCWGLGGPNAIDWLQDHSDFDSFGRAWEKHHSPHWITNDSSKIKNINNSIPINFIYNSNILSINY